MKTLLAKLIAGRDLDSAETEAIFDALFAGEADPVQVGGVLVALEAKGVTSTELAAAARAMRRHALPIDLGGDLDGVVDTCGTGGSGSGTFNISTATALVAAACGVRVVKHGNRAVSSKTGSADVLEALGVSLDADPKRSLEEAGIAFAFARTHHPAMRHVAPIRQSLGVPTIFNLLGPLTNPAGVRRQLLGVGRPDRPDRLEFVADALLELGTDRAWVVHSDDAQDDLAPGAMNTIAEVADGRVRTWRFNPAEHGLSGDVAALRVESPAESAALIRRILDGDEQGPPRDAVLLNAAAAVVIAGGCDNLGDGLDAARHALDTGRAAQTLEKLAASGNAASG